MSTQKKMNDYKQIVGITFSAFDLFHTGHVIMLKEAKQHCDFLIVGLQTDPSIERSLDKNKPIQSLFERYEQLVSCRYVDQIIPYATEKELNDMKFLLDQIDNKRTKITKSWKMSNEPV